MDAVAAAAGMASPMPLNIITNLTPASGKPPKSSAKSKGKSKPDSSDKARIKRDAWKSDKVVTILKAEGIMKDVTDIDGLLTYIRRARASEKDAARNAALARSCAVWEKANAQKEAVSTFVLFSSDFVFL